MRDCSKYLKNLYIGMFIFLFDGVLLKLKLVSVILSILVGVVLFIVSQVLMLPYFRCYGENMRKKR